MNLPVAEETVEANDEVVFFLTEKATRSLLPHWKGHA